MRTLQRIALILVIIGAINWGLIGFFSFDLVATIFGGQDAILSRIIYSLVGISGIYCLTLLFMPSEETDTYREVEPNHYTKNFNYETEFGEENDFSSLKKDKKKDNNK